MNSNYGKSGTSLNNFDFDLGIGTNRGGRSLNDQKNKSFPSYSYASSSTTTFAQSNPAKAPSWQPNKPSWTHQPAPSNPSTRTEIGGPASMVGDIFGKSWNAAVPSGSSGAGVGIANKNPNLFGDLVGSALGQNKGNSNAPLKSATPGSAPGKSAFSMGGVADSLPKTSNSGKSGGSSWSSGPFQNYGGIGNAGNNGGGHFGNTTANKGPTLGGPSIRSTVGANMGFGVGSGVSSSKDPFGSLVDFSTKPTGGASLNSGAKANATTTDDFASGDFQNASKSTASSFSSNTASGPKLDSFASQNPTPSQSSGVDSFDMFFSSSSAPSGVTTAATDIGGNQQFSGGDDWGMDSAFGGAEHDLGSTTELEGLPPPPPGVSASTAKNKGMDSHKQGQFADAIKWLSWAVILFEKAGNNDGTMDVLICRASCYKEVGEYKKAVADCTKVLDHDDENVAVLVQRALLYESMEKYRLGAEDLRTVMKLDPGNRVARGTIHRLPKMAE